MIICARCGAAVGNIVDHYEVHGGVPKARVFEMDELKPADPNPVRIEATRKYYRDIQRKKREVTPDQEEFLEKRRLERNRKAVAEWRERLEREALCGTATIASGTEVRVRSLQE